MADEEENTEEKGGGGMMKIILLVNGLLLIIGIAVGVTIFMLGGDDKPAESADAEMLEEVEGGGEEGGGGAAKPKGNPVYVPLHPAFIVNFENQEQVSFLQVDIQVMTYDAAVESALKAHMPAVRNELLLLLGGKQYHEINTREGKRALSQECIEVIQEVLKGVGEPSSIEALYFTSFVMQ